MLTTITVDVGTTGVKLSSFDAEGALAASARRATPTVRDAWGENYDLAALVGFIEEFIGELGQAARAGLERIAFTGVGESGGLVRHDLSLASPMILWHDHRGAEYLARLSAAEQSRMQRVTGLPVNANYGLSKVAWAVANAGSSAADAVWLNISEYLAARMTGHRWSENSLGSRTMALDLEQGTWSAEVCALVGLDVSVFPELHPASTGFGIDPQVANRLGLPSDLRVHVAGHDHIVGAVGAELRRGELLNSTGTTEGLLFLRALPSLDDKAAGAKLANGLSCTGDDFTLFASIPTGGSAFATLQSMLGIGPDELSARVAALHGAYVEGRRDARSAPLVLPRFRGSPPPTKDSSARAIIAGLGTDTSTDDLIFGAFVGMALQFRDVLELFPEHPERIKVIGPASRNPLWLQLKADLLGTELSVSRFPEVVSRGAQALASGATPAWASCDPVTVAPDPGRHAALGDWYADIRPQWEYLKAMPS